MSVDYKKYSASELTEEIIDQLIANKESFQVVAVTNISSVVNTIEGRIERKGLKCRVFSEFRKAVLTAAVIPTPVTVVGGWAAGIGIGLHNLVTWNPDFEIGKNKVMGTVTVSYKK